MFLKNLVILAQFGWNAIIALAGSPSGRSTESGFQTLEYTLVFTTGFPFNRLNWGWFRFSKTFLSEESSVRHTTAEWRWTRTKWLVDRKFSVEWSLQKRARILRVNECRTLSRTILMEWRCKLPLTPTDCTAWLLFVWQFARAISKRARFPGEICTFRTQIDRARCIVLMKIC